MHASSSPATNPWFGQELTIPAGQLRDALCRATTAAAQADRRPELSAVVLRWSADGLMFAAADGYRLVNVILRDVSIPSHWAVASNPDSLLLTPRTATAVLDLLSDAPATDLARFHLNASGNHIFIIAGGETRLSPFVGDEYKPIPPIPDAWLEWRTRVTVETDALRNALTAARISDRGGAPLLLEAAADSLRWLIGDVTGRRADAQGSVPAIVEGESLRITPNGDYVLQMLNTASTPHVQLTWRDHLKPLIMREVSSLASPSRPAVSHDPAHTDLPAVTTTWAVMPMEAPSVIHHEFAT